MARRGDLTENQIRAIKEMLIRGAHPTALAIAYGKSAETIRRIKRGETHNDVKVAGEEELRQDYGTIVAARPEGMSLGMPQVSQEEVAASEARLAQLLRKPMADRVVQEMKEGDDVERKAREMLGLDGSTN